MSKLKSQSDIRKEYAEAKQWFIEVYEMGLPVGDGSKEKFRNEWNALVPDALKFPIKPNGPQISDEDRAEALENLRPQIAKIKDDVIERFGKEYAALAVEARKKQLELLQSDNSSSRNSLAKACSKAESNRDAYLGEFKKPNSEVMFNYLEKFGKFNEFKWLETLHEKDIETFFPAENGMGAGKESPLYKAMETRFASITEWKAVDSGQAVTADDKKAADPAAGAKPGDPVAEDKNTAGENARRETQSIDKTSPIYKPLTDALSASDESKIKEHLKKAVGLGLKLDAEIDGTPLFVEALNSGKMKFIQAMEDGGFKFPPVLPYGSSSFRGDPYFHYTFTPQATRFLIKKLDDGITSELLSRFLETQASEKINKDPKLIDSILEHPKFSAKDEASQYYIGRALLLSGVKGDSETALKILNKTEQGMEGSQTAPAKPSEQLSGFIKTLCDYAYVNGSFTESKNASAVLDEVGKKYPEAVNSIEAGYKTERPTRNWERKALPKAQKELKALLTEIGKESEYDDLEKKIFTDLRDHGTIHAMQPNLLNDKEKLILAEALTRCQSDITLRAGQLYDGIIKNPEEREALLNKDPYLRPFIEAAIADLNKKRGKRTNAAPESPQNDDQKPQEKSRTDKLKDASKEHGGKLAFFGAAGVALGALWNKMRGKKQENAPGEEGQQQESGGGVLPWVVMGAGAAAALLGVYGLVTRGQAQGRAT